MLQIGNLFFDHWSIKECGGGNLEELFHTAPPVVQQSIINPQQFFTIINTSRSPKNLAKLLVFAVFDKDYLRHRNVHGSYVCGVVKESIDPSVMTWVRRVVEDLSRPGGWSACVTAINKAISDQIYKPDKTEQKITPQINDPEQN